jgi:cysteine sulfinate desulfinase/cysteine desulfurase-like protein
MTHTQRRIYLDHAATTRGCAVLEAMQPYWARHFGSILHPFSRT